jgi:hypothetical protein
MGGIRRNPGAGRRAMACSHSGPVLSVYGNNLDYPIETIDSLERERPVQVPSRVGVEAAVLENYITG